MMNKEINGNINKYVSIIMAVFIVYFMYKEPYDYGIVGKNIRYAISIGAIAFLIIILTTEEKGKINQISRWIFLVFFISMVGVKIYDFNFNRRIDKLCNHIEFDFNDVSKVKVEKVTPKSDRKRAPEERITDDKDKINYLKNYICNIDFTKVKSKSCIKDKEYLKEQMMFCISFINKKDERPDFNRLILEVFPNKIIVKDYINTTIYYSAQKVLDKNLLWEFYDSL